jgi:hypothetical protein
MTISAAIRLVVSAFTVSSIAFAASTKPPTAAQPLSEPAIPAANRMLDSIPSALFQKMFQSHKLVGSPGLAWRKQRVITVAFNGGSDELYQLIEQAATEWTALGGQLSFSFKDDVGRYHHWTAADTSPAANIRIAFDNTGYWSLLGVLAKNADPGDPTMNFDGFPEDLQKYFHGKNTAAWRTSYAHTTTLHEFGHALGLSHEHFNSQCQADLKMDTIITYLTGPPNNWSQEQARFNVDAQYYAKILGKQAGPLESKLITSATTDQSSVMLYVFPVSYYKSRDKSVCKPIGDHGEEWPTMLSEGDKKFYLANYRVISTPFGAANPLKENMEQDQCGGQITYESDVDDAYKYLEDQQRQIYMQNPHLTDAYSREEMKHPRSVATWAELKARALKACPDPLLRAQCVLDPDVVDRLMKALFCLTLPTRFEPPVFISLINTLTVGLDKVRVSHFSKSPVTRFGSLPTGTFDAQAILPLGSKVPLVILNRDIFFFTGALSKAIADSIPITMGEAVGLDYSELGIRRRLHDHPYIVHNFADAMSRLVQEGSSAGAIEETLDENHNHLHARLVGAMDRFLISHEEAHVILGHISDQSVEFRLAGSHRKASANAMLATPKAKIPTHPSNSSADRPPTTLKAELRTREQELQADALGFKLMIWSEEEGGDPVAEMIAAAAPHMVFRVLDAANAYGSEAGGWTFSDANHPSAADRIKALSPVFDEVAKTSEPMREVDFRIPFDAAFNVLLFEADPQIRQNLGLSAKTTGGR